MDGGDCKLPIVKGPHKQLILPSLVYKGSGLTLLYSSRVSLLYWLPVLFPAIPCNKIINDFLKDANKLFLDNSGGNMI